MELDDKVLVEKARRQLRKSPPENIVGLGELKEEDYHGGRGGIVARVNELQRRGLRVFDQDGLPAPAFFYAMASLHISGEDADGRLFVTYGEDLLAKRKELLEQYGVFCVRPDEMLP